MGLCTSSILPLGLGGGAYEARPVLGSLDLQGVADFMLSGKCRNVIWLSGAGVSVAAGLPDFRSKKGLYSSLGRYKLPAPEAIFDIKFFRKNPSPFYDLARKMYPGRHRPTATHFFIHLLHRKGMLLRNWTQNIDTLERVVGLPPKAIVEAHGSFAGASCSVCHKAGDPSMVKKKIMREEEPTCRKCGGLLKPDITFFGEALPQRVVELSKKDFKRCDLLIVAGTSLQVQPVAGFVQRVPRSTPRLLCNRVVVGVQEENDNKDSLTDGFRFGQHQNYRDVVQLGNCDDTVYRLAKLLGWTAELKALIQRFDMQRTCAKLGGAWSPV